MTRRVRKGNDLYGFRGDINNLANILFSKDKSYLKNIFSKSSPFFDVILNLILIGLGDILLAIGLKSVVLPHGFMTGGLSGVGLLFYYSIKLLSPGIWFLILNIPIFIAGWFYIGKNFFFYSLYGMCLLSLLIDNINFIIPVQDEFLSVLAGGIIIGIGTSLILNSKGSSGGFDIIGVILNKKLGISIGNSLFSFNAILFICTFYILTIDVLLYSLALSFVISQVFETISTTFNQCKTVIIITASPHNIAEYIHNEMERGVTFLHGSGSYLKENKNVILTVVNQQQIKKLERFVISTDSNSFMIIENTCNVIGKGFHPR